MCGTWNTGTLQGAEKLRVLGLVGIEINTGGNR